MKVLDNRAMLRANAEKVLPLDKSFYWGEEGEDCSVTFAVCFIM